MVNYYEILGVDSAAGISDIKAAFRRLAKQFHPDKNPENNGHFELILKAYETLSDENSKLAYDYRLNAHFEDAAPRRTSTSGTKNWRFDEREMKRRQYYNEYIKKHAKTTESYIRETEKKRYNEYKYIFFAIPLAVALFLLIMHLANPRSVKPPSRQQHAGVQPAITIAALPVNGDHPYADFFGEPQYDTTTNRTLNIKNLTGLNVIFCLKNQKGFVRGLYIERDYIALVQQLPPGELTYTFCRGSDFDPSVTADGAPVPGAFTIYLKFYKGAGTVNADSINELTLLPGSTHDYAEITAAEFFTK